MNSKNKGVWVLRWVYESIHKIMAGVNVLLDANMIVAMIKMGLGIIFVQSLALHSLFHF